MIWVEFCTQQVSNADTVLGRSQGPVYRILQRHFHVNFTAG